jgi:hypothetical protein
MREHCLFLTEELLEEFDIIQEICLKEDFLLEGKKNKGKSKDSHKERLAKKFKIDKFESGSIGYSSESKKWYGWSHRAICGFKIGDKININDHILIGTDGIKKGDVCKTEEDCKKWAKAVSKATG